VGGASLEVAFDKLTALRPPLCAKHFVGSLANPPVAVYKAKAVKACRREASNLLWGHVSLDLEV